MKILIVEDNTINQNLFLRLFRKLGYEPDIVSDGETLYPLPINNRMI